MQHPHPHSVDKQESESSETTTLIDLILERDRIQSAQDQPSIPLTSTYELLSFLTVLRKHRGKICSPISYSVKAIFPESRPIGPNERSLYRSTGEGDANRVAIIHGGLTWTCDFDNPQATNDNEGPGEYTPIGERIIYADDDFTPALRRCMEAPDSVRFIAIPLVIEWPYPCFAYFLPEEEELQNPLPSRAISQHSNMLIIDRQAKTLERFDPWGLKHEGADAYESESRLDDELALFAQEYGLTYLPPLFVCGLKPLVGVQTDREIIALRDAVAERFGATVSSYLPEGYCVIWTLWWMDLRLSNPNIPARILWREAIDSIGSQDESLSRFVWEYVRAMQRGVSTLLGAIEEASIIWFDPKTRQFGEEFQGADPIRLMKKFVTVLNITGDGIHPQPVIASVSESLGPGILFQKADGGEIDFLPLTAVGEKQLGLLRLPELDRVVGDVLDGLWSF